MGNLEADGLANGDTSGFNLELECIVDPDGHHRCVTVGRKAEEEFMVFTRCGDPPRTRKQPRHKPEDKLRVAGP